MLVTFLSGKRHMEVKTRSHELETVAARTQKDLVSPDCCCCITFSLLSRRAAKALKRIGSKDSKVLYGKEGSEAQE